MSIRSEVKKLTGFMEDTTKRVELIRGFVDNKLMISPEDAKHLLSELDGVRDDLRKAVELVSGPDEPARSH